MGIAANKWALASAPLVIASTTATAQLTEWGVEVSDNCTSNNFFNNFTCDLGPTPGGYNEFFASGSLTTPQGTAKGEATVGLIVSAKSFASGSGSDNEMYGVQGYTYAGPATTLTFNVSHSASVSDPLNNLTDSRAQVWLWSVSDMNNAGYGTTGMDMEGEAGFVPIDYVDMRFSSTTNGKQTINDSLTINVTDGEQFYLMFEVESQAQSGVADAYNTFSGTPIVPAGSTLTPSGVPEPSSLALLGLAGLATLRRRR